MNRQKIIWKVNSEVSKNCKVWSKELSVVAINVYYTGIKYILCHVLENFQIHCNYITLEETADLVTFMEQILNGKLRFLCSAYKSS